MIRQLLIESLLLAASGGLLGVVLAKLALAGLLAFVPNLGLPVNFDLSLDVRVLVFTAGVTTAAALLFGLLPALQASRPDLANVLREAAGLAGRKHARLRAAMLVAQVSISVVLLSGTVLLMRGLRSATDVDIGFDADRVALLSLDPTILGYDDARRSQLYRSLTDRVTALPATEMAGLAIYAPLGPRGDDARLVARAGADTVRIGYNAITPGFLSLLRIPIVRGRDFSSVSRNGAIVGERLAQRVWPGAEPLGQRFTVRGHEFEVVGVARDIKYRSVGEQPRLFAYFPLDRASDVRGGPIGVVLHARARANAAELAALLRRELSSIDPDVPAQSSLMTNGIQFSIFPAQLAGRVIGACGVLALVLVVVGLHALASYTVAQRTRELGVRMAVGAGANDILRLVVGQSARLALAGLLLGLPIALLSAGLLRSLLYGVPPTDPITYILVLLLLGIAVVAATYLPARRALRVDPLTALRAW
jgi:putative ABC transport system permease protein